MATIKLSNSTLIDSSSVKMGIDVDNKIAEITHGNIYTCVQDCWLVPNLPSGVMFNFVTTGGTSVAVCSFGGGGLAMMFAHEGQRVQVTGSYGYRIYGTC